MYRGLIVSIGGKGLSLLARDSSVSLDNLGHDGTTRFNTYTCSLVKRDKVIK